MLITVICCIQPARRVEVAIGDYVLDLSRWIKPISSSEGTYSGTVY